MSGKEAGLHSLGSEKPLKDSKQERGVCDQSFIFKKSVWLKCEIWMEEGMGRYLIRERERE